MNSRHLLVFLSVSIGCTSAETSLHSKDMDGDGYSSSEGDCNDGNPAVHPGALEQACNNIDDDCNGFVDDGVASWWMTERHVDSNGDGAYDESAVYREDGQPLSYRVHREQDDYFYALEKEWTYNDDATLATLDEVEHNRAGEAVRTLHWTYYTDSEGYRWGEGEADHNGDGLTDKHLQERTRDGLLWVRKEGLKDNGVWQQVWEYDYLDGQEIAFRHNSNGDEAWDTQLERDLDSHGNPTEERRDTNGDGTWDTIQHFENTYDHAENLAKVVVSEWGQRLSVTLQTWDAHHRITRVERRNGDDTLLYIGVTEFPSDPWMVAPFHDSAQRFTLTSENNWHYQVEKDWENGRVHEQRKRWNTEEVGWDQVTTYAYDNNALVGWIQRNADGDTQMASTIEVDLDGNPLVEQIVTPTNGWTVRTEQSFVCAQRD